MREPTKAPLTDREMLLLVYGALRAVHGIPKPNTTQLVGLMTKHLYP